MEFKKIFLLLSMSLTCSLSQQVFDEFNFDNLPINGDSPCGQGRCGSPSENERSGHSIQQDCVCFPKNNENVPVQTHLNIRGGKFTRTVIYMYRSNDNTTSIYIPNDEKQAIFPDLTVDYGDQLRPVTDERVNILFSQENHSTKHTTEPNLDINIIHNEENKNENVSPPDNAQVPQENLNVQNENQQNNEEALINVLAANNTHPADLPNDHTQNVKTYSNENEEYLKSMLLNIGLSQDSVGFNENNNDIYSSVQLNSHPKMKCFKGVCKLYLYCSRDECAKYILTLTQISNLGRLHMQPYIENAGKKLDNTANVNNSMQNVGLSGLFGIEDGENAFQNIHSNVLNSQILAVPNAGQVLSKQVETSEKIPNIIKHHIQKISIPSISKDYLYEDQNSYVPMLPTHYNKPLNYVRVPQNNGAKINNKIGNDRMNLVHSIDTDIFNKFASIPAQIGQETVRNFLNIIPGLDFSRKDQPAEESGDADKNKSILKSGSEAVESPNEEDDLIPRIIGGRPAISSGTPMQIKGRLGNLFII